MIASQTAWPFRWLEMAQQPRPCFSSVSRFACTYPSSSAALATSKWSPEQAISSPSYPHSPASRHISSNGRSAHCPVNKVTGRVCSGWAFPVASLIATPLFAGSEPVIAPRSELVEDHRPAQDQDTPYPSSGTPLNKPKTPLDKLRHSVDPAQGTFGTVTQVPLSAESSMASQMAAARAPSAKVGRPSVGGSPVECARTAA